MQAWIILADYSHVWYACNEETIFEDRLFFVGKNLDVVREQLKAIINNPLPVIQDQFELECDRYMFYPPKDNDEVVLQIRLVKDEPYEINAYINFKLILLDLHEHSTLQTSIPDEIILEMRKQLSDKFGGNDHVD